MYDWRDEIVDDALADANALGIYSPLRLSKTHQNGTYNLHIADRFFGVDVTVVECDDLDKVRAKLMQAAPISDTRDLIWTESVRDHLLRPLAIGLGVEPAQGVDAVRVKYAYRHAGSWVYLYRFLVLRRFTSPRDLLDMLKAMIPDFTAEEAERRSAPNRAQNGPHSTTDPTKATRH